MNISYNWLRELTDIEHEPRELARRLTAVGLAVDAVHESNNDYIIEIDLTSNRPDCLSHVGVAREVAAFEKGSVRLPETIVNAVEGLTGSFASVEILDEELCPRYAARVVRGVKIGPSPAWLAARLEAIGQRPINNVADITNYVLHEFGQPLHAFDLATLTGKRIIVRRAGAGEKIKTLDGFVRELDAEMLVIADAARAVAIAGVMGGEETEISDSTTDVLIESAYFNPASVRRTSKRLGLQTEASYRFERGTDYDGVRRAQDRCVALICEIAGGVATEDLIDLCPRPIESGRVTLRPARVEALTGISVSDDECLRILTALGFEPDNVNSQSLNQHAELTLRVPSWRVDVALEEDLVEEVARHAGYEKIIDELPPSVLSGEYLEGENRRRAARRALTDLGFDEAINFSFIDAAHDGQFDLMPGLEAVDDNAERFVTLSNPVIEGLTRMRPTLLPGLLDAVRRNSNHGTRNVRLFEFGRVFAAAPAGEPLPTERQAFALVLTGGEIEQGKAEPTRQLDFYDLKGALESAATSLNLDALEFEAASARHLREGQAARVSLNGRMVGTLGRLSEEVADAYKFRQPVYVAEVNLDALLETPELPVRYTPLPRYPAVTRDASLLVPRLITFDELRRAVLDLDIEYCRSVSLVDVYEGANVPDGQRSLTLRAEYRADDRTLRDEEVDLMQARVVETLTAKFGAQLRGRG
ncbi:MAG: phenylalanine--tRNA ligase subunit beta [Pyrinomonadaceae bacterium]